MGSIDSRIRMLKAGHRKHEYKKFSLSEDLLIMDRMLKELPGKRLEDLYMLVDDATKELVSTLGKRMVTSLMKRWGVHLKPWILQHYAGTLNLDIKKMLANYIADTFDSFDSIDWALVVKRPEFAGHTLFSLRSLFYGNLFYYTKKQQNLAPAEVTLRHIADLTNMEHGVMKKVTEGVLLRQMQVIDYFEQYTKKQGITNLL